MLINYKICNNKFNILSLGIITIFILSLMFIGIKERNIKAYNEKIYINALQNNLVHINDSRVYLEQIIGDYENINDYELKLNSIAENIACIGDIFPIITNNDKARSFFNISTDEYPNSFVVCFMKYSQIVKDWSINIDEEIGYGYPDLEDLKGLQSDLNQYHNLFTIKEEGNNYYIGNVELKDFNYSYVSNSIIKIISNSYFDDIKKLY